MDRDAFRWADWAAVVMWRSPRLRARLLRLWLWLRLTTRSAVVAGAAGVLFSLNNPALGAGGPLVRAATIAVVDGEVAVADNGLCSLIEAIHNANDTRDALSFRTYQELKQQGELRLRVLQHIPVCNLPHALGLGLRSGSPPRPRSRCASTSAS